MPSRCDDEPRGTSFMEFLLYQPTLTNFYSPNSTHKLRIRESKHESLILQCGKERKGSPRTRST